MKQHFDNILSKYQCDFYEGYNLQHSLTATVEK